MSQDTRLQTLLERTSVRSVHAPNGNWDETVVSNVEHDSRRVVPGTLFFSIRGSRVDGHQFIPEAVAKGACAIIAEHTPAESFDVKELSLPVIFVDNIRLVLSEVAARFYGEPALQLINVGVTGTNGKTSVAWIAASILCDLGIPAALVGTLGVGLPGDKSDEKLYLFEKTSTTTPDPVELHAFLARSRELGIKAAVVEATSQGHVQHRTSSIDWNSMIFTNLSRDHLDLHGSLEAYAAIKKSLFTESLPKSRKSAKTAVVNLDDPLGRDILSALGSHSASLSCYTFSTQNTEADSFVSSVAGDIHQSIVEATLLGKQISFRSKLVGHYNVSNVLAAATALVSLGYPVDEICEAIARVPPVPGRLELVGNADIHVFVDYAHTPDALVKAQQSLRPLCSKRLITVFGCGGDRDRGKRPLMGQAVAELSDYAVVTSDNPRTEDPEKIIEDILPGIGQGESNPNFHFQTVVKRDEAIAEAIREANPGDVVLVAGKGHEDYQEIHGVKYPFLDRNVCLGVMRNQGIL